MKLILPSIGVNRVSAGPDRCGWNQAPGSSSAHRARACLRGAWLALAGLSGWLLAVRPAGGAEVISEQVVVPELLNYQGRLETLDAAKAYTNGVYDIEFRIWSASTAGTLLWGERYSVYVKDGRFNVVLGTHESVLDHVKYNTLRDVFRMEPGATDRFLGITVVQDENQVKLANPTESFPRQQLLPTAFAVQAQYAQYARQGPPNGQFQVLGGMAVSGGETLAQGGLRSTKGLTVSGGATELQTGLQVSGGQAVMTKGLLVTNDTARMANGLDVSGLTTLRGGATVNGSATFSDAVTVNKKAALSGGAQIAGGITVGGAAKLNNDLDVSGKAELRSGATVSGGATIGGGGTINGGATIKDGMNVFGNVGMMKGWEAREADKTFTADTDGFFLVYWTQGEGFLVLEWKDAGGVSRTFDQPLMAGPSDRSAQLCVPVKKGTKYGTKGVTANIKSLYWMPCGQ